MPKFSFGKFAGGFLDAANEHQSKLRDAQIKADERRAENADKWEYFLKTSEKELDINKELLDFKAQQKEKEEAAKSQRSLEAMNRYMSWRNGSKDPSVAKPGKPPSLQELYQAKAGAELEGMQNVADAIQAEIDMQKNTQTFDQAVMGIGGGNPQESLTKKFDLDILNKQSRLLDTDIYGPETNDPTEATGTAIDLIEQSRANATQLLSYLADETRMTNPVTGVPEARSKFAADQLAQDAIDIERNFNTLIADVTPGIEPKRQVTFQDKLNAVKKISKALEKAGIKGEDILADERLQSVFTPARRVEYNRILREFKNTGGITAEKEGGSNNVPAPAKLPTRKEDLKTGKLYQTPKGLLFWNGSTFTSNPVQFK